MKKRGFTIIEMVIVVMILIILAVAAIWSSKETSTKAEIANIMSELKAVRTGVLRINSEYNMGIIDSYIPGTHYNTIITENTDEGSGDWYVIYGLESSQYDEDIIKNLGLNELKRNYKVDFETADVEFLDGPVTINEYEINSYEEMQTLIESGVI